MTNAVPLQATIDHDLIREWAERRAARPSMPSRERGRWPLFFDFGPPDPGLVNVDWDRFFEEFERANLAFIYRDATPDGSLDDLHEFVKRSAIPDLMTSSKSTVGPSRSRSMRTGRLARTRCPA